MVDPITSFKARDIARRWIGTPYIQGAALRGVGCDCIGLIRGVYGEITGAAAPPAPAWRDDWARPGGRALITGAARYLMAVDLRAARPGDVLVLRDGARLAHIVILDGPAEILHAAEGLGVVKVSADHFLPRTVWAGRFPTH